MPLIAQNPRSRIILGLMTFGPKTEDGARITDLDTFNEALDLFQARGYGEVDTARVYIGGAQEAFTREAGWSKRGLTLATKVKYPAEPGDNTADEVVESVETSLCELGIDCVDVRFPCVPVPKGEGEGEGEGERRGARGEALMGDSCSTSTAPTGRRPFRRRSRRWTGCTRRASLCAWASATLPPLRWPRWS